MKKYEIPAQFDQPWVRMPPVGQFLFGLSRTALFDLVKDGKIRSYHHKKPGRVKGVRLIWLPSLAEYLEQNADESQHPATKE
jgi:hypothetical protein